MKVELKQLVRLADWAAVAAAIALPWSTSATAILIVAWLITLIPTLNLATIGREIKSPVGGLPVLLWLLGAIGMLWAGVSWPERFGGLGSFHRLLMIPLLLAQFRRSANGWFVLYGFLLSAVVLLLTSYALVLGFISWHTNWAPGVVVHDTIAQSTIFLVCSFALLWAIRDCMLERKWWPAGGLSALAALFFLNLIFVASSRADVVVAPLLLILLGWRWLRWKGAIVACIATAIMATSAWMSSPYLRARVQEAVDNAQIYRATGVHNDVGDHIEFVKKAIGFVREAPIIGHGTGSMPELFRGSTIGQSGAAAIVSVNPHNQILAVAIQLGSIGAAVLLAMWVAHYFLFRATNLVAWIGTVVVVENVGTSMSSSHLFDFVHGWLYVFAVGVLGGLTFGNSRIRSHTERGA